MTSEAARGRPTGSSAPRAGLITSCPPQVSGLPWSVDDGTSNPLPHGGVFVDIRKNARVPFPLQSAPDAITLRTGSGLTDHATPRAARKDGGPWTTPVWMRFVA